MWNVTLQQRAVHGTGAARKRGPTALSLEQLVQERKRKLEGERAAAPELRARAKRLRAAADAMDARYQHRMRADTLSDAEALEHEAIVRETRIREIEFERVSAQYLSHYHKTPPCPSTTAATSHAADALPPGGGCGDGGDLDAAAVAADDAVVSSRIITVPGTRNETAQVFASKTSAREARRQAIVSEFLKDVESEAPKLVVRSRDDCPFCASSLFLNHVKAMLVCTQCGYTLPYLDSTTQNMSYTEEYDFSTFSYKRQSHFEDILKLSQGKESFVVETDIIVAVMRELHAQRVPKHEITQTMVRATLRKLRLRRAYDHVSQITTRITGVRTPRISTEMEDRCRAMFIKMQSAFEKFCPKNRKNFLSYNYVLFRCYHILGLHHMLPGLSLLKGKEKLLLQDEIFENIAHENGWVFQPINDVLATLHPDAQDAVHP